MAAKHATVDDYIASLPPELGERARQVREAIVGAVPEAAEAMKYDMPAFLIDGRSFLFFSVWKKHIGLYPIYRGSAELEALVGEYRDHKDTLQFRHDRPLPLELITELASRKFAAIRG